MIFLRLESIWGAIHQLNTDDVQLDIRIVTAPIGDFGDHGRMSEETSEGIHSWRWPEVDDPPKLLLSYRLLQSISAWRSQINGAIQICHALTDSSLHCTRIKRSSFVDTFIQKRISKLHRAALDFQFNSHVCGRLAPINSRQGQRSKLCYHHHFQTALATVLTIPPDRIIRLVQKRSLIEFSHSTVAVLGNRSEWVLFKAA